MVLVGRVDLRIVTLYAAGLAVYLVWRSTQAEFNPDLTPRLPINLRPDFSLAVLLLILAVTIQAGTFAGDGLRPVGSEAANEGAAYWATTSHERVFTDLHTYSIMSLERAEFGKTKQTEQVVYTHERYENIINRDKKPFEFDIFVVNNQFGDQPMMRGWIDWTFFKPIGMYEDQVNYNQRVNRIYDSEKYHMYVPSTG
jgi:hypothetical protein